MLRASREPLAAYHGHPDTVSALLKRKADPNRTNDRGQTALAGTVHKGHDKVVHVLLDHGADPSAGRPTAIEAAQLFNRDDLLERMTSST